MKENYYEKLLNINTAGNENWNKTSPHNHPYQPTLYEALDTLFEKYDLDEDDHIVDFGSGKGRIVFYINHFFRCYANGVEMNEIYYNESLLNKSKYIQKHKKMEDKVNFYCNLSQNYNVEEKDNKFYFFNYYVRRSIIGFIVYFRQIASPINQVIFTVSGCITIFPEKINCKIKFVRVYCD